MRNTLSEWLPGPLIRSTVIRDIKISYAPRDMQRSEKRPLSYSSCFQRRRDRGDCVFSLRTYKFTIKHGYSVRRTSRLIADNCTKKFNQLCCAALYRRVCCTRCCIRKVWHLGACFRIMMYFDVLDTIEFHGNCQTACNVF